MSQKSRTVTRGLRLLVIASTIGTFVFMMVPTTEAKRPGGKPPSGSSFTVACNGGTVSISPARLWPPNHKMRNASVTYTDESVEDSTLTLTVNGITDDQSSVDGSGDGGCGRPNESQDWSFDSKPVSGPEGAISENVLLRAERCAGDKADGGTRTYDINVTCENDPPTAAPTGTGPTSTSSPTATPTPSIETTDVFVTVPHDNGKH